MRAGRRYQENLFRSPDGLGIKTIWGIVFLVKWLIFSFIQQEVSCGRRPGLVEDTDIHDATDTEAGSRTSSTSTMTASDELDIMRTSYEEQIQRLKEVRIFFTAFLIRPEILIWKPIRGSKNLRVHPIFRSAGTLGNMVMSRIDPEWYLNWSLGKKFGLTVQKR